MCAPNVMANHPNVVEKSSSKPHGGAGGKVWGSTKSSRSEKTSVPSFVPGHLVSVEAYHGISE